MKRKPKTQSYTFSVRPGFHINKRAAEDVGRVIVELTERGNYTPEALVQAARSPRSPAHKHFEWDDERAAHQHRLTQARFYQRGIEYSFMVKGARKKLVELQMRVAYPIGDGSYRSGRDVITDRDMVERLLDEALDRLEQWRQQYAMLRGKAKLSGVFWEIDKVVSRRRKAKAA